MGVRGFTVVKEMAEFMYEGCLFPYRFRSTVQDGGVADVYDAELPVKLGETEPFLELDPIFGHDVFPQFK